MKLLDQPRDKTGKRHYSICTEQAYVGWIKRFSIYHGKRHANDMGESEISQYLSGLPSDLKVAVSTQSRGLCGDTFCLAPAGCGKWSEGNEW
jgi:hypothetical protein